VNKKFAREKTRVGDMEQEQDQVVFRYLRMQGNVSEALGASKALCLRVLGGQSLAVGFSNGDVSIVSLTGTLLDQWSAHTAPVIALSTEATGEYLASCSADGNIVVKQVNLNVAGKEAAEASAQSETALETHPFGQPLSCVTLDPGYARKNEKVLVAGGEQGQLLLCRKSWFTQRDSVIHEGEGGIAAIAWVGTLVAWANERGVKIMDIETEEKITFVERPVGVDLKCCLLWESPQSLMIAWSQTVHILVVCLMSLDLSAEAAPRRAAQIVRMWSVEADCTICGIASFDEDSVTMLACVTDESGAPAMPELQIRSRLSGELLHVPDGLPLQGFATIECSEYSLQSNRSGQPLALTSSSWRRTDWLKEMSPEDRKLSVRPVSSRKSNSTSMARNLPPVMYLVTPYEVIVARVRNLDDFVASAMRERRFKDALTLARANPTALRRTRLPDVVQVFLEDLLHHEHYAEAAAACPELFRGDAHAWEYWLLRFMKSGQLHALAPHIPTGSQSLDPAVYALVLDHFLAHDSAAFLATVKLWSVASRSKSLFSVPTTMQRIAAHLAAHGFDPPVVEAQAVLLVMAREYEDALSCFLRLNAKNISDPKLVFDLIETHSLFAAVLRKIPSLVGLSRTCAGELLVKAAHDQLPIELVAKQLAGEQLLWYLHTLFTQQLELYNSAKYEDLHAKQVELYALVGPSAAALLEPSPLERSAEDASTDAHDEAAEKTPSSHMIEFLNWSSIASSDPSFLQVAYEVCAAANPPLWNEMVFILSRQQQSQEALQILLTEVGDVRRAIQFVESEKDSSLTKVLWDDLINFSLERKAFLNGMLDYAGLYSVELPSRLIREIPPDMEIDYLQHKLMSIMEDYRFQRSLQQGCRDTMETWYHRERTKLYQLQRKGRRAVPTNPMQGEFTTANATRATSGPSANVISPISTGWR